MKWILIPGLGADERLFANIVDLLPDHQIIRFESPEREETIEQYADRLRGQMKPDGPFVLGGVSFGGMLSSILCEKLKPAALVLMASTHHPEALGQSIRAFEWLSRVWPETFARWVRQLGSHTLRWLEPIPPDHLELFKAMARDGRLEHIRGGARMIMKWRRAPVIPCPRYHLHGSRDLLISVDKVHATRVIPGAGHLLNLTHAPQVREFITHVQQQLECWK